MDLDEVKRGIDVATTFIAYRMRSEFEIRRRLKRAGIEGAEADAVVQRLSEMHLVDDRSFAAAYTRDHMLGRKRGPIRVKQGLAALGVSRDLAEEAVDSLTDSLDTFEQALDLGRRRWHQVRYSRDRTRRKKRVYDFLVRRGYDFDEVRRVVGRLEEEDRSG